MHLNPFAVVQILLAFLLAPLAIGVINRTKAFFGGRRGRPFLQLYWDILKLLRKGNTYSTTTTWVIRLMPWAGFASLLAAMTILPMGPTGAMIAFPGDLFVALYVLAMLRFLLVIAALDTGSPFEGMGASREVMFSALLEPAVMLALVCLARLTNSWSISAIYATLDPAKWLSIDPVIILIVAVLFLALLVESSRVPIDDPDTHLELTMIHEVMILDCGGPDLGVVLYTASLKLWLFAGLISGLVVPRTGHFVVDVAFFLMGNFVIAVSVGIAESIMARIRMIRVSQLLLGAIVLSAIALTLVTRA